MSRQKVTSQIRLSAHVATSGDVMLPASFNSIYAWLNSP